MLRQDDVVRARINKDVKERAAAILSRIGLTPSDAYRMLMMKIVEEEKLPFDPIVPNETTMRAINAARDGDLETVHSIGELFADEADSDKD